MPIGRKCSRFANLASIPSSLTTAGRLRGIFNREDTMRLIVIFSLLLSATTAIAAPAEKKATTAEQACQAQALASIARQWPNVVQGYFEIIIKGGRCLVFLETPGGICRQARGAADRRQNRGAAVRVRRSKRHQGAWFMQLSRGQISDQRMHLG